MTIHAELDRGRAPALEWAENVWMGVSVETDRYRIACVAKTPCIRPCGARNAAARFCRADS